MTSDPNGHVPPGWSVARLDECVDVLDKGRRPVNATERAKRQGNIPYYGATGQVGWIDKPLFDEELVLLGEDGAPFLDKSKPIAYVIDGPSWVNNHAHVLRARPAVTSNRYLKYFLDSFDFSDRVGGSTRDKLTQRDMNSIPVLLAPAEHQRQIVRTLDEIDEHRTSIAARLAAARAIVDRLRTAVLAAACSGRLTADWREAQDRSEMRGCGSSISGADPDLLGDIPDSWRAVSLGQLIERIEAGKSVRADGRRAEPDEWGVIKVSAMSWGSFLQHENKAVVDPALVNPRYEIHADDLLISRANTVNLVGATVHVLETRPRLLLSDKSLRLVPRGGVNKAWLNMAMGSPASRSQLADQATGTSESMRNLSQPKILGTALGLPPLSEQHEIVHRAKVVLATVDRLGTAINRAEAALIRASRGALARAFRGDLVAERVA